jgi:translocation and assembly module TamB
MSHSPDAENIIKSQPSKRFWLIVLRRFGIVSGGALLLLIGGGAWWVWNFIQKELAPLAQQNLTTTLKRPVNLGKIEEISLTGVRFGASAIPATANDPDRVTIDAIEVGLDPIQLLLTRTLKLDVTLINPNLYIEQDKEKRWVTTSLPQPGPPGAIKTELAKLHLRNATLLLIPDSPKKIQNNPQTSSTLSEDAMKDTINRVSTNSTLSKDTINRVSINSLTYTELNGTVDFFEQNQLIKFDVAGRPGSGGNVSIEGEIRPRKQETKLRVKPEELLASDITPIVNLPIELQAGRVSGDIEVQIQQQQPALLFGRATAQFVKLRVPGVPQPFSNSFGNLSFQGLAINLENLKTNYGKIPLIANGTLDRKKGFKLGAKINTVSASNALETLKIKSPLPTSGEFKADLQLTGLISKPVLSGTVANIKPAQIDKVDIENVSTNFVFTPSASVIQLKDIQAKPQLGGSIKGDGTIRIGRNAAIDVNLTASNLPGEAYAALYEINPGVTIGTVNATTRLVGAPNNVQTLVKFQAPQATYPATGELTVSPQRKVTFRNVALSVAEGKVFASGNWVNQRWQTVAQLQDVQLEPFISNSQLPSSSPIGRDRINSVSTGSPPPLNLKGVSLKGGVFLSGTTAPFKVASIRPQGMQVAIGGGTVAVSNVEIGEQNFSAQLAASGVRLGRVLTAKLPPVLQNPLAGNFQISGSRENFDLKTLTGTGEARLAAAGGTITAKNIQLANGVYQTQLLANAVRVQELAQVPTQLQGAFTGLFYVAGSVDSFSLQNIQAEGQGQLNVAAGRINLSNVNLASGRYKAKVQAANVPLQGLVKVPPLFRGNLTGNLDIAGSIDSFKPETIIAKGQGSLNAIGGIITANNIQVTNGRYQALVDAAGVDLNRFNQQLRGELAARQLQVAGDLKNISIANVTAAGQVQLSQGISLLKQPLTALVDWNGQQLNIQQATSRDARANGVITAATNRLGVPEITDINLNVQANNLDLKELPFKFPQMVAVNGIADYAGQITGKLPTPNLLGELRLRDLRVNKYVFEPVLTGNIQSVTGQGLNLDVKGENDRVAVNLDARNRPNSFALQWGQVSATGEKQGENLLASVRNLPLKEFNFNLPPSALLGNGVLGGVLAGNFLVNPDTFTTKGNLAVTQPEMGRIKGDSLTASFDYENGKLSLTSSEFVKGSSSYGFAGDIAQSSKGPQIIGDLSIKQGQIQDVLTTLQIFEVRDLGRGVVAPEYGGEADLRTKPQGLPPNADVFSQILRFTEIKNKLAIQEQERINSSPIPELADLKGIFNGNIKVNTSDGTVADFDLNGQNFEWGRKEEPGRYYDAQKIIVKGRFENGILRLQPFSIESNKKQIAFVGSLGGNEQSGQLRVVNFPIALLNNFINLPRPLTGNLSATAAIAGSIKNPQARGELQLTDLNQPEIQSANGSFSYAGGRLNFGSNVAVTGPEPVIVTGSIPVGLGDFQANNDALSLDVKVKNQGLAVINLLTNQVQFEKGEGEIDLTVRGTIDKPEVKGNVIVKDAIFSAQALPEKLTNVNGQIEFDRNIAVIKETIRGQFSKGQVLAYGQIPLADSPISTIKNPLTLQLENLALNLRGLYQGGASGTLQILGSAQVPIIGGKVELANGKVLLADTAGTASSGRGDGIGVKSPSQPQVKQNKLIAQNENSVTQLNDLEIVLGKNVFISRPPILNFRAEGALKVSGSLSDPIPEGIISLKEGGVNLFTTQFNLVRGYKNEAEFRPSEPRDPLLDVRLSAKVLDVIQSMDINRQGATGLAALETVRVEATVQGLASEINYEGLELKSTPARSQTELIALLGGGSVDTQGRGDSTLGLINIAGSAVLGNFQSTLNQIGTAFGLSELRVFPTVLSQNPEAGRSSSSLELAAEAGIDISPKVSLSILSIFTASDPVQFGINYRINDDFRLRSSTNLTNDNRAVVEFERRF